MMCERRKSSGTFSKERVSEGDNDTTPCRTMPIGRQGSRAPALPASSGKVTSKPLTTGHPRLSTETGLVDSPGIGKISNRQKKRRGGSIMADTPFPAADNKISSRFKRRNDNYSAIEAPSNGRSKHSSANGGVDNSSSNNSSSIYKESIFMGRIAGADGGGETSMKRRRATDALASRDSESLHSVKTKDALVGDRDFRRVDNKGRRRGRESSAPSENFPGIKRPRSNTLNLAYQAQKAAADDRKRDGWRGSDARGGGERDVPSAEKAQYIGLDCEMVGVGPNGCRSALAWCCVVDWDGKIIFDKYVNPAERVTDFRTFVSGVRAKDLIGGLSLRQCQIEIAAIMKEKYIVGHALQNDLKALRMTHPPHMTRDTATYRPFKKSRGPEGGKLQPMSLKKLALEYLGQVIQEGQHHPAEDARAAMDLYKLVRSQWEKSLPLSGKRRGRRAIVNQQAP